MTTDEHCNLLLLKICRSLWNIDQLIDGSHRWVHNYICTQIWALLENATLWNEIPFPMFCFSFCKKSKQSKISLSIFFQFTNSHELTNFEVRPKSYTRLRKIFTILDKSNRCAVPKTTSSKTAAVKPLCSSSSRTSTSSSPPTPSSSWSSLKWL